MSIKLNSSGGGSVSLQEPVTSSNLTLSLPARTGNVAVDGPAFSAYQSSTQAIANNTWTKYTPQTEEFDTANCFDNASNYRFQPNVAGYYQLTGNVSFNSVNGEVLCGIYKNGTAVKYGSDFSTTAIWMCQVMAVVYLNGSTDYVELYVFQSTGASRNTFIDGSVPAARGYFQGFLVRAA